MKVEIQEKRKNPLLKREEVEFIVEESNNTPSKADIRKKLSALCNASENLIIVECIKNKFGSKSFLGNANIYSNEEDMKRIELKHKVRRNFGGKEEKKEENAQTAEEKK